MSETELSAPLRRVQVERTHTYDLPRAVLWQVYGDTERLNRLFLGLDAMQVVDRDEEKLRIRGGFGVFGLEFEEHPWHFEAPRAYHTVRVFTRGVLKRIEARCELEEEAGRTQVRYQTSVDLPAWAAPVFGWVYRLRVTRALDAIERFVKRSVSPTGVTWPLSYPHGDAVRGRARPFVEAALAVEPADEAILHRLVEHLATADAADVGRMRPFALAEAWGVSRAALLACCLRATRAGLLTLSWDLLCPSCENAAGFGAARLRDLRDAAHCDLCDVDFSASFERNVEATFRPAPGVRESEPAVFCYGSPSHTPSWIAQAVVPPKTTRELTLHLGAGRYRIQAAGVEGRCLLEVVEDAGPPRLEVALPPGADGARPRLSDTDGKLGAGEVTLALHNNDERPRRVQLAHRAFATMAATAADVTSLGVFRDLFGEDVLAPDQHIRVGCTTLVFTDLIGSTAMYERLGDAQAYGLVREHFRILEGVIAGGEGRIVKTIGDAVMAAFDRTSDAVAAVAEGIRSVEAMRDRSGAPAGLALKVGVHEGPCLAVQANLVSDYFGRTVNEAARVQGLAGSSELVLSEAAARAPRVGEQLARLEAEGARIRRDRCRVKGVERELELVRVKLSATERSEG